MSAYSVPVPAGGCRDCAEEVYTEERWMTSYSQVNRGRVRLSSDPTLRHVRTGRLECDVVPQVVMVVEPTAGGPDALWMVASKGECPGAYWPVRRQHYRASSVWRCACPWGREQDAKSAPDRIACRHLKAVAAFETKRNARPVSPPAISSLVD